MAENMKDVFLCRSLQLMNFLCAHGYKVTKVRDSNKDKRYKVFYFKNTPELEKLASDYIVSSKVR